MCCHHSGMLSGDGGWLRDKMGNQQPSVVSCYRYWTLSSSVHSFVWRKWRASGVRGVEIVTSVRTCGAADLFLMLNILPIHAMWHIYPKTGTFMRKNRQRRNLILISRLKKSSVISFQVWILQQLTVYPIERRKIVLDSNLRRSYWVVTNKFLLHIWTSDRYLMPYRLTYFCMFG
jgi:hypothetical protein